jgi:hypothetical protein
MPRRFRAWRGKKSVGLPLPTTPPNMPVMQGKLKSLIAEQSAAGIELP